MRCSETLIIGIPSYSIRGDTCEENGHLVHEPISTGIDRISALYLMEIPTDILGCP